ncbi:thioesterase Superfamily protein [Corallococcus coralloides DSM 2259]|uniref:Thioesterase Superfamily protein n=1 Tax=Corallococcus coralloides (strain ATCC 25202 / DSM 2259 / NBRC 100086 / M2) TaxID=1144275 RepID=H8MID8_CORCM|nr:thioesterase family protein [Corallococcus coralloides]AFE10719.1 thioesterase Superfamily protein [Corallococcus coralloides DSM 2259]
MSDAETADRYRFFLPITTRWMDNDVYGHINNVTYYSYFDTVANHYLIHEGGLDIHTGEVIGLVVESKCAYRAPLAYPDRLRAGLCVDRLGNRSVTYGIAIFKEGEEQAAAHGHFVHVFVDRRTRRAVAMPDRLRDALAKLVVAPREQA